jgi:uncharacterized membrane protein YccC
MFDAGLMLLSAALCFSGMAWLALAMEVHWHQVMRRPDGQSPIKRIVLRWLGALALCVALAVCLLVDRPSMAVLVWTLLLAAGAFAVAMVLSQRPRWLALWAGEIRQPSPPSMRR